MDTMIRFSAQSNAIKEVLEPIMALQRMIMSGCTNITDIDVDYDKERNLDGYPMGATVTIHTI